MKKTQLDIKHVDGTMMLVIVLVRSLNSGRSEKREAQIKRSIQTQRKKLRGLFNRQNVKQKDCKPVFKTAKRMLKTN